jgi:hypothetical protein
MKAWSTYCSRLVLIEIRLIFIDPQLCVAGHSAKKSVKGSTMSVSCRQEVHYLRFVIGGVGIPSNDILVAIFFEIK